MSTALLINAVLCALACGRIVAYRRQGATYYPLASLLAYLLALLMGSVPILTLLGHYHEPELPELLISGVFCASIWAVRGNVVDLFRTAQAEGYLSRLLRKHAHDYQAPTR